MGPGEVAHSPALYAALVLLGVLGTVLATRYFAARWDSWVRSRRGLRAQAGERAALHLLTQAGFEVLASQCRTRWSCWVDGREESFDLVADYLLTRDGRRWVAEVKTGDRVANVRHAATRRQLLEYQQAFGAAGLVLVDASRAKVHHIEFAPVQTYGVDRGRQRWTWLVVGVAGGASLGWMAARYITPAPVPGCPEAGTHSRPCPAAFSASLDSFSGRERLKGAGSE